MLKLFLSGKRPNSRSATFIGDITMLMISKPDHHPARWSEKVSVVERVTPLLPFAQLNLKQEESFDDFPFRKVPLRDDHEL